MMQYYGAGVPALLPLGQDCMTHRLNKKGSKAETIAWYKKYREILNADIIHLRRADGRDWDGIMHVNPWKHKALLMLYSPLKEIAQNHKTAFVLL